MPDDPRKPIPPEEWIIEVPFDSSEWLGRPVPRYADEDELGDGTEPPTDEDLIDPELGQA